VQCSHACSRRESNNWHDVRCQSLDITDRQHWSVVFVKTLDHLELHLRRHSLPTSSSLPSYLCMENGSEWKVLNWTWISCFRSNEPRAVIGTQRFWMVEMTYASSCVVLQ
jgi:hypothetical protein